ncbi:MAG: tRNA pseudouridine(38-40) synthase TruA [Bacteroidota bacterium]
MYKPTNTQRYFMTITYKGTAYHGWQRQDGVPTVQGTLEDSLAQLRVPCLLSGSSRTDKGVHAIGQVAHVDLPADVDSQQLHHRLNRLLPSDIYVHTIDQVAPTAHARFDALERKYIYHITTVPNPFLAATSHYCPYPLDMEKMNEAVSYLLGTHNCQSFCKGHANVPNHVCHITHARWQEKEEKRTFSIHANRFVHGMVRAIVGTLIEVGRGRLTPNDIPKIIAQKDRCAAKSAAPPQGLFLQEVVYDLPPPKTPL